ncbi:MAG TPA: EFR1 family ferrodoxin [Methanomicrobiales archaeon]|nr:EFR1 family ferrodoxin [Methanomicrobiales archaeon]
MKTILYYFTGTGNSLAVAEGLARRLGDTEVVPIASLAGLPAPITPAAERVGIITPVYFFGLPSLVAVFSARLDLVKVNYVFAVATMGGSGGSAALRQLDSILKRGPGGKGLDAGFTVRMPGNYVLMYEPPSGKKQKELLKEADRQVEEIAEAVKKGRKVRLPWSFFAFVVNGLMYPRFIAGVGEADRKFTVDDRCTNCGICEAVCPVENIRLEAGRPVWLHHCEQCLACIQHCPTGAIQAGPETENRGRYRHPEVGIEDLKRRKV